MEAMHIENDVPLGPLTTLGIGGPARHLVRCSTVEQICEALEWAAGRGLPVHVLGGGSNTLFADAGLEGLVLRVELAGVETDRVQAITEVRAAAGVDWDDLVADCTEQNLVGLECLSGIPGSVGATPIQNVGAYGQEIARLLVAVDAIDRATLNRVRIDAEDCGFSYRNSRFKGPDRDRYLITGVTYQLSHDRPPEIRYPELQTRLDAAHIDLKNLAPGREASSAVRDLVLQIRRSKGMVVNPEDANTRSAGSFFLNPILTAAQYEEASARWKVSNRDGAEIPSYPTAMQDAAASSTAEPPRHKVAAAWLVEQAGYPRGTAMAGAAVSPHHALALVSRSGREDDLLQLARAIQAAVEETFGICLQREPVRIDPQGRIIPATDNDS